MDHETFKAPLPSPSKKPYESPTLVEYGTLAELTASTSKNGSGDNNTGSTHKTN